MLKSKAIEVISNKIAVSDESKGAENLCNGEIGGRVQMLKTGADLAAGELPQAAAESV